MNSHRFPTTEAPDALGAVERRIVEHTFVLSPSFAVFLGLHEYDGRLPDWSPAATDRWAATADRLLEELRAVPAEGLSPARELDRLLLRLELESPLFDLREARDFERNPMVYVGTFGLTAYLVREYASVPDRVRAIVRVLEGVPRLLEEGRRRLERELPKPFVELALSIGGGLAAHFGEAEAFATRSSADLGARVHDARAPAEAAITDFLERLRDEFLPRANDAFALGPARFQRLLWVREGIEAPFSTILAEGREDLRRNQERLRAIAAERDPPPSVPALLEEFYADHPTAAELVPTAQRMVEEARSFVRAKDLATIPEPAVCRVEETPVYGRALSTASMNPPGPFDAKGDEGIYFVTPVDATWTPAKQEEWLRSLNFAMLRNITIHEVFPGHYLQFLHFRHAPGSLTRKVYFSASFTEGWAHYTEQLAIEQQLANGQRGAEVAQLHDALLRDCRLVASIGLHTGGMSVAEATRLFQSEAYFEELPAEREAIRGTFNPEYFCYTLGKLAILRARSNLLASRFGGSLRRFHDALLSQGSPPVGVLDRLFAAA